MNKRLIPVLALILCVGSAQAFPVPPATNKDGSPVSGVLEAAFDPSSAVIPFPSNLLYPTSGPIDLTLQLPPTDPGNPNDPSDPRVALSALDGFSTTEKWVANFLGTPVGLTGRPPGEIDPSSVVPGHSVRVFEVATTGYPYLGVAGIVRELTPGAEFVAAAPGGGVLAIVPTSPLKEFTTYMAVLTNDINDLAGNDATPSRVYHLTKKRTPLVDANGKSTIALLPDASARALEPLRQITQSMELNAAAYGIDPDDIVLSWTVHTQSIKPTLKLLRSLAEPADTILAPTGLDTSALGLRGLADIYIGVITLPYFLGAPSADNPIAFLTQRWEAAPGGYFPPYDQAGLDPDSTNLTAVNPLPVLRGFQTVPVLLTVPGARSGFSKPAGGWPVVIYQHGLTRERTDLLAIADTMASVGYAVIGIDQPLHGVVPDVKPQLAPFDIRNTPFGAIAKERTFYVDIVNNETGAPGPDGLEDGSGTHSLNLLNLQVARDNMRQASIDISVLALSIQNMSIDGDAIPDLNGMNVALASQSAGAFVSNVTAAFEPVISRAFFAVGGGGVMRTIEGGYFGAAIRAGLAAAGIEPGTADYESFLLAAQTLFDPGDPINWGAEAAARIPILSQLVIGDEFVPNYVPGAPLAGGEAQIRVMGQKSFSTTQVDPDGLRAASRFVPPAAHQSIFDPQYSPAATVEMQTQMASFLASSGTFIQVDNPDVMRPVAGIRADGQVELTVTGDDGRSKSRNKPARPAND